MTAQEPSKIGLSDVNVLPALLPGETITAWLTRMHTVELYSVVNAGVRALMKRTPYSDRELVVLRDEIDAYLKREW